MKPIAILIAILLTSISYLNAQVVEGVYKKDTVSAPKIIPVRKIKNNLMITPFAFGSVKKSKAELVDQKSVKVESKGSYSMQDPKLLKRFKHLLFVDPASVNVEAGNDITGQTHLFFTENPKKFLESKVRGSLQIPNSTRFYIDTSFYTFTGEDLYFTLKDGYKVSNKESYTQPFFISKEEVTNLEYREFVSWVRDSIIRTALSKAGKAGYGTINKQSGLIELNWKTPINMHDEDTKIALKEIALPESLSYFHRFSIDTRKIIYSFNGKDIAIYPDTSCWIKDFPYSFSEPMGNMYFWHPAYDNYPVVGVTYFQALAFLDWATKMLQQKMNADGFKYKIKYDLPTEAQWDMVATAELEMKKLTLFSYNYSFLADESYFTDLKLFNTDTNSIISAPFGDNLRIPLKISYITHGNFISNGAYHTTNVFGKKKMKNTDNHIVMDDNQDPTGMSFMGGNVSEWLKEDFAINWKPMFEKRQRLLRSMKREDCSLLADLELFYFKNNDPNGKLVRGCNWFDERFSSKYKKNPEGFNAKLFVNPNKAYSTLGFRYVLTFEKIN